MKKIVNGLLDIELGHFTEKDFDVILKKFKAEKLEALAKYL